jgi:hypothetical protein
VDAWANERLSYETDDVRRTLVELAKFYFGTEFQSKTTEEKEAFLREDEDSSSSNVPPKRIMLAGAVKTPEDYILDSSRMGTGGGGSSSPLLRSPVVGGRGLAPSSSPRAPAAPAGGASPGHWVEVGRGRVGLEHQSKMSGQPIRQTGGKYYINEYKVGNVHFDDYQDGKLYEYKGNYANFIGKNEEFRGWFKGAIAVRSQAVRQLEAAGGIPVIWLVGPNQVKAFEKAIGPIPGLSIMP